ncbi:MAG: methyltransferase domain-containing protein [Pseudomonadota bacterium]
MTRARRARAAAAFGDFDFLHRRAMDDIVDRLETVKRDFPVAGFSGAGSLIDQLTPQCAVGSVINMDAAAARLPASGLRCVADEEASPLAPASLDLYVSLLTLHTANDLVGALAQTRTALKPDGLFIAAIFAEQTLESARQALYRAEAEICSGVSPRFAPMATIQDLGNALSRAGFALPVADVDAVRVEYGDLIALFRDLRGMGESASLVEGGRALRRDVIALAAQYFGQDQRDLRFDLVYLTAWAPDKSQPKPKAPGSATASLEEAIKKSG